MDYDVTDYGDGHYSVSERYGSEAGSGGTIFVAVVSCIAYLLTIISLIMATIGVSDIPFAFIILIVIDVFAISPLILYPIAQKKEKSVGSIFLSIFKFIGKYAYIPFSITYVALWILYFCKITGPIFVTLFFFSMYGIYYFPYYMLKTAQKHNSGVISILTLVAIYVGLIAMAVVAAITQMDWYYAMIFPSTLALFALISVSISNIYYKKHYSKYEALKLTTFFKILGISVIVIVVIFALIVMIVK